MHFTRVTQHLCSTAAFSPDHENRAGSRNLAQSYPSKPIRLVVPLAPSGDVQDALSLQGMEAIGSTSEDFAARIKADMEKTAKVVRELGMKLN